MNKGLLGAIAALTLTAFSSHASVPVGSTPSSSLASRRDATDLKLSLMGIAPKFFTTIKAELKQARAAHRKPITTGNWNSLLFVDDNASRTVDAYKYTSAQLWNNYHGDIDGTAGISDPDGNWVGVGGVNFQSKWLFVANPLAANVQEYKNGQSTSPSFTFTSNLVDPVDVTSDKSMNLYVADYSGGFVNKYTISQNTVTATCSPGGSVEGVAVNSASGNVYVSYNDNANVGHIVKYTNFLTGCNGTAVATAVTFGFVGGIVLDPNNRLLVCDQTNAVIDRLSGPSYNTVSATYGTSYVSDPLHATLNRTGSNGSNRLYVSDPALNTVWFFGYPGGAYQSKLDSNTIPPLNLPMGAVRWKNFNS